MTSRRNVGPPEMRAGFVYIPLHILQVRRMDARKVNLSSPQEREWPQYRAGLLRGWWTGNIV